MRTAADCFTDLLRHVQTGEPIAEPDLRAIAHEAHGYGCNISLAFLPLDPGRFQLVNCWTTNFGKGAFAETAQYRIGDTPTLIYQN